MYSFKAVLTQKPEDVKASILLILAALIVTGAITVSPEAVAAWGLAIERCLGLFYVKPLVSGIQQQANDDTALKGIELGKAIAHQRPIRVQQHFDA